MTKKKPITVTIKETKHPTQKWEVSIDMPGNGPHYMPQEHYARPSTAARGVNRYLEAVPVNGIMGAYVKIKGKFEWRPIEFIVVKLKKK